MKAFKSLQKEYPELAKQWHPSRNGHLTPLDVTKGSHKKVWWKCDKGHEWEATIKNRSKGRGCPYCSGHKLTYERSLAAKKPELAIQWHFKRNEPLSQKNIAYKSNKKVWWKCDKGHEWEATVSNRTNGDGCPYCSGRKAGKDNNLAILFSDIAKQWHRTKNGQLTPYDVIPGTAKKVWWICAKGHEWKAVVYHRINGVGCPYCANQKAGEDNNLAITFPELAKEWLSTKNINIKPTDVVPGSHRKVWWRCERGHEWKAQIKARVRGNGCPFCTHHSSRFEIRIYCELKSIFPGTVLRKKINGDECDVYIPDLNIGVEVDGYYWHKKRVQKDIEKCERLKKNGINLFRLREHKLEKLSEFDVCFKETESEYEVFKRLLNTILEYYPSKQIINPINQYLLRSSFQNNSDYKKIISYFPSPLPENSLDEQSKHLAMQWNFTKNYPLTPSMFTPKSHKNVWWKCEEGHEWEATIANRTAGNSCPYCAGQKSCEDNNLAVISPHLAAQWHPIKNKLLPREVTPGSSKKVWWKFEKGHEWEAIISDRSAGNGCPYCAGKKVCSDNNLADLFPDLGKQWHPTKNGQLTPQSVTPGSSKKVWWRCEKGHEWEAQICNRKIGNGCPYCSGKRVGKDNNLAVLYPNLANQWHAIRNKDLTPFTVRPNSHKKVWWQCDKGHKWESTVAHRTKGSGCPYCAGKKVCADNNLAVFYPELAEQWHPIKNAPLTSHDVRPKSHKAVWWRCNNGHEWQAQISSRTRGEKVTCPYCKGRKR